MRSLFEKKPWVVLLAVLALGALTVLSVSLRNVSFKEAQPIGWGDGPSALGRDGGAEVRPIFNISIELQIGLFVSLLLLAGLFSLLVSTEARKRFLRLVLNLAFTYWVLSYVIKKYPGMLTLFNSGAISDIASSAAGNGIEVPRAIFTPPQQTPLLTYAISVLIILIALFFTWRLFLFWQRLTGTGNTLTVVAQIARRSLKELSSGANSTDVIMNCYRHMSDVVADRKSLHREIHMTPSEFAVRLERSGLPGDAVRRLTRLFESVRYGGNMAGPKETNEAVACLTDILHYCGESV